MIPYYYENFNHTLYTGVRARFLLFSLLDFLSPRLSLSPTFSLPDFLSFFSSLPDLLKKQLLATSPLSPISPEEGRFLTLSLSLSLSLFFISCFRGFRFRFLISISDCVFSISYFDFLFSISYFDFRFSISYFDFWFRFRFDIFVFSFFRVSEVSDSDFQISDLIFSISDFRDFDSDFRFWFRFSDSDFRFQFSDSVNSDSDSDYQISGFVISDSDLIFPMLF